MGRPGTEVLYQGQQLLDYVLAKILQRVTQPGKQNTTRYAQKPEHTAPPVSSVRGHGPVPSPGSRPELQTAWPARGL